MGKGEGIHKEQLEEKRRDEKNESTKSAPKDKKAKKENKISSSRSWKQEESYSTTVAEDAIAAAEKRKSRAVKEIEKTK